MKFIVCFIFAALCVYVKSAPAPNSELAPPAIPDDTISKDTSSKQTVVLSTEVVSNDYIGPMSAPVMAMNYIQDRVNDPINAVENFIEDLEEKATGAQKIVDGVHKITDVGFDKVEELVGKVVGKESGAVKIIDGVQVGVDKSLDTAGFVIGAVGDKAGEVLELVGNVKNAVGGAINNVKKVVMGQ